MDKNKRTANYTKEECWLLVEIIEKYAHIIENKKTDALTWKEKKDAWKSVCIKFNSVGTQNRTWEQLRSKYETLKKDTRKAAAKRRATLIGTGGGPCEDFMDPLHEKVKLLIKLSCEGLVSNFDSDCINTASAASTTQPINDNQENIVTILDATFIMEDDVDDTEVSKLITNEEESTEGGAHDICRKYNENLTPKMNKRKLEHEEGKPNIEIGASWATYSPAQLRKPTHPALHQKKKETVQLSAAGKTMQPWMDAKTELTNLKLKLLQQEFDGKQKREKEIHLQQTQLNKQQMEINELAIEKLKLEIEKLQQQI